MSDPFYRSKAWHRLRSIVLRDQPTCATPGCGKASVAVDHIVQRAKGGADEVGNLRGLCISCHNSRRHGGEPRAKGCTADGSPADPGHWWNEPNRSGLGGATVQGGFPRVSFTSGRPVRPARRG